MGRKTNGTTQYLRRTGSAVAATPPFSIAVCWTGGSFLVSQLDNGSGTWNGHYLSAGADGRPSCTTVVNTVFTASTAVPIGLNKNTRQIAVGVWKSTSSRQAFLNGVIGPEQTSNLTPAVAPNDLCIGGHSHVTVDNLVAVDDMKWVAFWNVALDLGDIQKLSSQNNAANQFPILIRREALVDAWLFTDGLGRVGSSDLISLTSTRTLTATGAPPITPDFGSPVTGTLVNKFGQLFTTRRINFVGTTVPIASRSTLARLGTGVGSRHLHGSGQ